MKINEVEALVGITRKNIRFYEEQGLLSPRRNSENGYRDYGEEEVDTLRQIKLMRKLGVPLEEIRQMQSGTRTVGDAMRRHMVTLERQRQNVIQSMELCAMLEHQEIRLDALDAAGVLAQMETLEQSGATFQNNQREDIRIRYVAPLVVSAGMFLLMGAAIAWMIWAFMLEPSQAPPLPLMAILIALPLLVILGMALALAQRIREIEKGEADDAKKY